MEDPSGMRESFERTIMQAATALMTITAITASIAKNTAVTTPIAKFAAETIKEVEWSVIDLILTPTLSPSSGLD